MVFDEGINRQCVNVVTIDDNIDEGLECVQVNANSLSPALRIVPNERPNQLFTEVCCIDDDSE